MPTQYDKMAHLLRRAAFGARPDEIENYLKQGFEATVDQLLDYDSVPEAPAVPATPLTRDGTSYPIDLTQMMALGKNPQDIMVQPGDMLRVSTRDDNTAYVMGEVNKPIAATPTSDGKLTLADALSQAGFINQGTADPRQLYVIREQKGKPEVYHLDAHSPVSMLLANQFDLRPKDVVYVDNGPLVRFNRVLSLLLPAINAGLATAIVTK